MLVKKRLNNNVVLAENENKEQVIIMGNGLGYKSYPGDIVKKEKIERTFILKKDSEDELSRVSSLLGEIPTNIIMLCDQIIRLAETSLDTEFGIGMLVSLSDHVYTTVKRAKNNINITNPLHWDIQQLYPNEALIGRKAVELINAELHISLNSSEATAIAMHFISNANNYESVQQAMNFTKIISDIIHIIEYHFQFTIDQRSMSFSRLVTHLQYFLVRQVKEIKSFEISEEMLELVIRQYNESFRCAEKIIVYLEKKFSAKPSLEEEVYLTLHIQRVLDSK